MKSTSEKETERKRLDVHFSIFNLHVNDAGERADVEFKAQFGEAKWNEHIKPLHDAGIMSIFQSTPSMYTMAWASLCAYFVNEEVS
jgi:hypothetical protein